jgi:hypothetical protein
VGGGLWCVAKNPTASTLRQVRNTLRDTLVRAAAVAFIAIVAVTGGAVPANAARAADSDLLAKARRVLVDVAPRSWYDAVPRARIVKIIDGHSSYAHYSGGISVGRIHATSSDAKLRYVIAHELGHHIAYDYGDQSVLAAAPAGFPQGTRRVETWADCVGWALSGRQLSGTNVGVRCSAKGLRWTKQWLAKGPSAHPVTW